MNNQELKDHLYRRIDNLSDALFSKINSISVDQDFKIDALVQTIDLIVKSNEDNNKKTLEDLKTINSHIENFIRQEQLHESKMETVQDILKKTQDTLNNRVSELYIKIDELEDELKKHTDGCDD